MPVQLVFAFVTNSYIVGYLNGRIYTGASKAVCVPGLSCYSCPGALGACPLGSFQAMLGARDFRFPFYITGLLTVIGILFGRFVCGWLCPFGLVQDLLYKLPFAKKIIRLPGDKILRFVKYGILIGFVILFPLFVVDIAGQGQAGFCKWICPSGTFMAGWPLYLTSELIRDATGLLFAWKSLILAVLLILSIFVFRPFCSYLCPLGAFYGLFNPIAFYRMQIDEKLCIKCGTCKSVCKFSIPVYDVPNSKECIRCGECVKACPVGAIEKKIAWTR